MDGKRGDSVAVSLYPLMVRADQPCRVPGSRVFEGPIQPLVSEPSNPVRSYLGMQPIIHTALCGLAAVLVLTGTAAAKPSFGDPPGGRVIPRLSTTDGAPVELAAQPGSEADKLARQLMAREIARAHAEGTDPLVLVGMGRLLRDSKVGRTTLLSRYSLMRVVEWHVATSVQEDVVTLRG